MIISINKRIIVGIIQIMQGMGINMSQYVNMEMSYNTYLKLCDAVEKATEHTQDFYDIRELVHLADFLEEEYERNIRKENLDYKTWKLHEELFRNKEIYHHEYFYIVNDIFEDNIERGLLEWNISEQDKFHMICELIDVFEKDDS